MVSKNIPDSIAKKLKEESKISFNFEGNKKQFYFNSGLAEKVHSASTAGWDLVNEYLSDELASGSEDEKRIRRAKQRALRKRKDRQQQKVKSTVKQSQPSATTT